MESRTTEVPSVINGERIYSGQKSKQSNPWNHHGPSLAEYHEVDADAVKMKAVPGALAARNQWANMPFHHRAAIYKKAAKLVESPKYRWKLMAATMIGQGKTCEQADGDCITEVIDTLNFHVYFCAQLYRQQPPKQFDSSSSRLDYRALEGFVLAVSPFNFTALGAHIAFTPALVGNVIIWKPSPMAVLSNYILYEIMEEAGMPKGVIQFLPGQKCSALSRLYVPKSMWQQGDLKHALLREAAKMTHGSDVKELHHPLGPMISGASFSRFEKFVQRAKEEGHVLLYGGEVNGSEGFFVQPAIFEVDETKLTKDSDIMTKELFGPLFVVHPYDDMAPAGFKDVCRLIDRTSEYALAGSLFARDREAIWTADQILRDSVGMFCINDKSTGAVIGAHPFGGARSSGTNDKANSMNVLLRFTSIRCVKDSFLSESTTLGACHVAD
ncbi:pyrroline-5-carboxylate dehydrogenase [Aspergillus luchuensis]|uniref:Pyrroline-5-carboxylate dehydrogenase n=1 Tax=Aspergillus kawachii TaxID=1069201 RepID=A0A146F7M7_ASPKA|nr:pyrroline-5-carboxylate dehydrogenase [Aspergillus luchuensis]